MIRTFKDIRRFVASRYVARVGSPETIALITELEQENRTVSAALELRKRVAGKFTGRYVFGRTLVSGTVGVSLLVLLYMYNYTDEGYDFRSGLIQGEASGQNAPYVMGDIYEHGGLTGREHYAALMDARQKRLRGEGDSMRVYKAAIETREATIVKMVRKRQAAEKAAVEQIP